MERMERRKTEDQKNRVYLINNDVLQMGISEKNTGVRVLWKLRTSKAESKQLKKWAKKMMLVNFVYYKIRGD